MWSGVEAIASACGWREGFSCCLVISRARTCRVHCGVHYWSRDRTRHPIKRSCAHKCSFLQTCTRAHLHTNAHQAKTHMYKTHARMRVRNVCADFTLFAKCKRKRMRVVVLYFTIYIHIILNEVARCTPLNCMESLSLYFIFIFAL